MQRPGRIQPRIPQIENVVINDNVHVELQKILETLNVHEKDVLKLYFGIGCDTEHTLEEIGIRFNLTRERIRQIKSKALCKLKKANYLRKLKKLTEN